MVKGGNSMKVIDQYQGKNFALYNGDCVEVAKGLPDNSIHYSIFSPPFASLYTYSNSERDMGNCKSDEEFYENFSFLIKELYRLTMPGRLVSFHCMDIPAMKERDGYIGLKDFPGDLIRLFIDDEAADFFNAITRLEKRKNEAILSGETSRVSRLINIIENMEEELKEYEHSGTKFIYHSRVAIWKDPLIEATRTKALGLMHKQLCKDSAMCRNGLPDYLITMRKPGDNLEPIAHHDGLKSFIGEDEPKEGNLSHQVWRRYASPVWMDINQSNTLQKESAREEKDERHICPLQLDVIARGIELYSNSNDIVFSPFAGIGSEIYQAIKMGRRGIGIELKESYYEQAVKNCIRAETEANQVTLLDLIK
jgi:DNA modification methylase